MVDVYAMMHLQKKRKAAEDAIEDYAKKTGHELNLGNPLAALMARDWVNTSFSIGIPEELKYTSAIIEAYFDTLNMEMQLKEMALTATAMEVIDGDFGAELNVCSYEYNIAMERVRLLRTRFS